MEVQEAETQDIGSLLFKRIGVDIGFGSRHALEDSGQIPANHRLLAVSNTYGLAVFGDSCGFYAVRTAELLEIAEKVKEEGTSAAEVVRSHGGIIQVTLTRVQILTLCSDELTLAAVDGNGKIKFYDLPSLMSKMSLVPFEERDCQGASLAEFHWSPVDPAAYVAITTEGLVYQGKTGEGLNSPAAKDKQTVSWSPDGRHLALVTRDGLLEVVSSSSAAAVYSLQLPMEVLEPDEGTQTHVVSARWVRGDSLLLEYEDEEGMERPLMLLKSSTVGLHQKETTKSLVALRGIFPCIDPDLEGGPMLVDYLRAWNIAVLASSKSTDDHINIVQWGQPQEGEAGPGEVVPLQITDDSWVPRIELSASGGDNTVVGLALDLTSVGRRLTDPKDDSGQSLLPPSPVLLCVTLEGKLSIYHFARLDEEAASQTGMVKAPSPLPAPRPRKPPAMKAEPAPGEGELPPVSPVPRVVEEKTPAPEVDKRPSSLLAPSVVEKAEEGLGARTKSEEEEEEVAPGEVDLKAGARDEVLGVSQAGKLPGSSFALTSALSAPPLASRGRPPGAGAFGTLEGASPFGGTAVKPPTLLFGTPTTSPFSTSMPSTPTLPSTQKPPQGPAPPSPPIAGFGAPTPGLSSAGGLPAGSTTTSFPPLGSFQLGAGTSPFGAKSGPGFGAGSASASAAGTGAGFASAVTPSVFGTSSGPPTLSAAAPSHQTGAPSHSLAPFFGSTGKPLPGAGFNLFSTFGGAGTPSPLLAIGRPPPSLSERELPPVPAAAPTPSSPFGVLASSSALTVSSVSPTAASNQVQAPALSSQAGTPTSGLEFALSPSSSTTRASPPRAQRPTRFGPPSGQSTSATSARAFTQAVGPSLPPAGAPQAADQPDSLSDTGDSSPSKRLNRVALPFQHSAGGRGAPPAAKPQLPSPPSAPADLFSPAGSAVTTAVKSALDEAASSARSFPERHPPPPARSVPKLAEPHPTVGVARAVTPKQKLIPFTPVPSKPSSPPVFPPPSDLSSRTLAKYGPPRELQVAVPSAVKPGASDVEADFLLALEKVRVMSREIDNLMAYIEGQPVRAEGQNEDGEEEEEDGFVTRSFNRLQVENFERALTMVGAEANSFRKEVEELKRRMEEVRDEVLRVDAWQVHLQSRIEAAADPHRQGLLQKQPLPPHMAQQRSRIVQSEAALTHAVSDLRSHLSTLELSQRQGQLAASQRSRSRESSTRAKQAQEVQRLYNTVNCQLSSARELQKQVDAILAVLHVPPKPATPSSSGRTPQAGRGGGAGGTPLRPAAKSILKALGISPEDLMMDPDEATSEEEGGGGRGGREGPYSPCRARQLSFGEGVEGQLAAGQGRGSPSPVGGRARKTAGGRGREGGGGTGRRGTGGGSVRREPEALAKILGTLKVTATTINRPSPISKDATKTPPKPSYSTAVSTQPASKAAVVAPTKPGVSKEVRAQPRVARRVQKLSTQSMTPGAAGQVLGEGAPLLGGVPAWPGGRSLSPRSASEPNLLALVNEEEGAEEGEGSHIHDVRRTGKMSRGSGAGAMARSSGTVSSPFPPPGFAPVAGGQAGGMGFGSSAGFGSGGFGPGAATQQGSTPSRGLGLSGFAGLGSATGQSFLGGGGTLPRASFALGTPPAGSTGLLAAPAGSAATGSVPPGPPVSGPTLGTQSPKPQVPIRSSSASIGSPFPSPSATASGTVFGGGFASLFGNQGSGPHAPVPPYGTGFGTPPGLGGGLVFGKPASSAAPAPSAASAAPASPVVTGGASQGHSASASTPPFALGSTSPFGAFASAATRPPPVPQEEPKEEPATGAAPGGGPSEAAAQASNAAGRPRSSASDAAAQAALRRAAAASQAKGSPTLSTSDSSTGGSPETSFGQPAAASVAQSPSPTLASASTTTSSASEISTTPAPKQPLASTQPASPTPPSIQAPQSKPAAFAGLTPPSISGSPFAVNLGTPSPLQEVPSPVAQTTGAFSLAGSSSSSGATLASGLRTSTPPPTAVCSGGPFGSSPAPSFGFGPSSQPDQPSGTAHAQIGAHVPGVTLSGVQHAAPEKAPKAAASPEPTGSAPPPKQPGSEMARKEVREEEEARAEVERGPGPDMGAAEGRGEEEEREEEALEGEREEGSQKEKVSGEKVEEAAIQEVPEGEVEERVEKEEEQEGLGERKGKESGAAKSEIGEDQAGRGSEAEETKRRKGRADFESSKASRPTESKLSEASLAQAHAPRQTAVPTPPSTRTMTAGTSATLAVVPTGEAAGAAASPVPSAVSSAAPLAAPITTPVAGTPAPGGSQSTPGAPTGFGAIPSSAGAVAGSFPVPSFGSSSSETTRPAFGASPPRAPFSSMTASQPFASPSSPPPSSAAFSPKSPFAVPSGQVSLFGASSPSLGPVSSPPPSSIFPAFSSPTAGTPPTTSPGFPSPSSSPGQVSIPQQKALFAPPLSTAEDDEEDMDEENDEKQDKGGGGGFPGGGAFGSLGVLGLGTPSPASSSSLQTNPFGATASAPLPSWSTPTPGGALFKPASFSIPSAAQSAAPGPLTSSGSSFGSSQGGASGGGGPFGGVSSGGLFGQPSAFGFGASSQPGGFGQPACLGAGGAGPAGAAAFGSFGQTRSLGGHFGAPAPIGGVGAPPGYAAAALATNGGFAAAATGGGFAGAGTGSGFGAFRSSSSSGGFAGFAQGQNSGGLAGSQSSAAGFGASQPTGGFAASGGSARPPGQAPLFTEMRK